MKKKILILAAVLFIISTACTITIPIPTVEPGVTQTMNINEALVDRGGQAAVNIEMDAGSMQINGGGTGIVQGSIEYNIEDWKPALTRADNQVTLTQKPALTINIPTDKIINQWKLSLGDTPMDLSINANAYKGNVDLTDVPVRNLTVKDAAGENRIVFNRTNPEVLEKLTYTTSASAGNLIGLGFANINEMEFNASAGSYTLDFSGTLQRQASVQVTGAGCNIKIIIPNGMRSSIENHSTAATVDVTRGEWTIDGSHYSTNGEGPLLEIKVDIGAGRLELTQP